MTSSSNPIQQKYWNRLFEDERAITEHMDKTFKKSQFAVAKVTIFYFLLVSVFFGWILNNSFPQNSGTWYWAWVGYGGTMMMIYWMLFLSPYKNMKNHMNLSLREYLEDVVYDDPKNPSTFIKEHLKEQKYTFCAYLYFWCLGFVMVMYLYNTEWVLISSNQSEWLNKLPSLIPITLMFGLGINVVFSILLGSASPKTKKGKLMKLLFFIVVGVTLIVIIILSFYHAPVIQDFFNNFESYSTRYPKEPTEIFNLFGEEIFINYNILFWFLFMVITALSSAAFLLVLDAYHNHAIRKGFDKLYNDMLEKEVELNWQYTNHKIRVQKDEEKLKKIKIISAIELTSFFILVEFALWGLYYYWGERVDNQAMINLAIGIMGVQLLWALIFAPIFHYKLEKGILYKGAKNNLGYVVAEDRGLGSWWKFWGEHRHKKSTKNFLVIVNLLSACGAMGFIMQGELDSVLEVVGISPEAALASSSTLFSIISVVLLLFTISVMKFEDGKDPEQGYKKIYGYMLTAFIMGLVFIGIPLTIKDSGTVIANFYATFNWLSLWALVAPIILLGILLGLMNVIAWPVFIKYDDLYESIKDLIQIIFIGIVIMLTWNWMCEIFLDAGSGITHHSWRSEDPVALREDFHLGNFLTNVFGYHYWGWVQELLFLGYFCWLSWKIFPDPNSWHKWINATISSLLFGLFHYDNMPLMLGTIIGGFAWAIWFGERRNMYMLGLMHGFNGSLVDYLIPMSMTVGPGGL